MTDSNYKTPQEQEMVGLAKHFIDFMIIKYTAENYNVRFFHFK